VADSLIYARRRVIITGIWKRAQLLPGMSIFTLPIADRLAANVTIARRGALAKALISSVPHPSNSRAVPALA
jgi:hypothetical protein